MYHGRNRLLALTPEEVVWFRYFNPLEEYAGLSPVAPSRMAVDMGRDGLRFNRNFLRNSAQPDFVILANEQLNDSEVEDFYRRWEARFRGPANARRPAVASFVRDIKTLGLSHREMDFIQGPALESGGGEPRLRRAPAAAFRPGAGPLSPTSTPPNVSSGATPWCRR